MRYVTTNIRLGTQIYHRLRLKAAYERKSLAQLVRDAVETVYGERRQRPGSSKETKRNDPFFNIIGMGSSGIRDGALHHDRDVYGVEP